MSPLSPLEFHLLNDWQHDFPLVERPYAELAASVGSTEEAVIDALKKLQADGRVSRVGAVFRPHVLGWSTLAAVAAPAERVEAVARLINAYPEVNHNYLREHAFNIWFVVTAPSRERVGEVLGEIGRQTGLMPLDLPMLEDFHIDLGFSLGDNRAPHRAPATRTNDPENVRRLLGPMDYALAAAMESGLALTARPYAALAASLGVSEADLRERLARLLQLGVIRRFGVVVRHRELGYTANAMVVWDIPDEQVTEMGRRLSAEPCVTLCYRRPRRLPHWPYNLFSMIHGKDRQAVLDEVRRLQLSLGVDASRSEPLFSCRRFKQCGARYSSLQRAA